MSTKEYLDEYVKLLRTESDLAEPYQGIVIYVVAGKDVDGNLAGWVTAGKQNLNSVSDELVVKVADCLLHNLGRAMYSVIGIAPSPEVQSQLIAWIIEGYLARSKEDKERDE